MASKTQKPKRPAPSTSVAKRSDGYAPIVDERTDLDGYWMPERGPLHGKLVSAFQFIQKTGKSRGKTQTVFVFDLADPCVALVKLDGGGKDEDTLAPRSLCGVIMTYGLRALVQYGGCFVKLEREPTKRTLGNGNEMWAYTMAAKPPKGKTLDIRPPLVSGGTSNGASPGREPGDDSDETPAAADLPF